MNNNIKIIFAFAFGVTAGSVVTWKLIKTKYEKIAQEEIDSVKEVYSRRKKDKEEKKEIETEDKELSYIKDRDRDREKYAEVLSTCKYYKEGGSESMKEIKPYVISPEEFGENDDYEQISLIYYSDDVLTDEFNEPIYDLDMTVGSDFASHFGEYEDDSVFIANDRLKCYYEICRDYGKHSDLKGDE